MLRRWFGWQAGLPDSHPLSHVLCLTFLPCIQNADLELVELEGADLTDAVLEGAMVSRAARPWSCDGLGAPGSTTECVQVLGVSQECAVFKCAAGQGGQAAAGQPCNKASHPHLRAARGPPLPPQLTNAQVSRIKSIQGADFTDALIRKDVQQMLCKIAGGLGLQEWQAGPGGCCLPT